MSPTVKTHLADEQATYDFASLLATALAAQGAVIYLQGDLGAGKTSLTRGFLQALGYAGRVVSPTYTLIEPYKLPSGQRVFHLDLYRVSDPEELVMLGLRDIDTERDLMLVEWPELGVGELPPADLLVNISDGSASTGREMSLQAQTPRAEAWLQGLRETI